MHSRKSHLSLSCLSLVAMVSTATLADNRSAGYLNELVVTGTRTERQLLDTPVRTEVVTAEEIEKTHARNLKEALENVPGLQLRKSTASPVTRSGSRALNPTGCWF